METPKIQSTKDYDKFKIYFHNRKVKDTFVDDLVASIKDMDLTDVRPIIVNERMEIIDGQHTFTACKKLGLPIHYVVKKGIADQTDKVIIKLNASSHNWAILDYVKHYADKGFQDYQLALDVVRDSGLTISNSLLVVAQEKVHSEIIRSGKFKRGPMDYKQIIRVWTDFKGIFREYNHVFFIRALVIMLKSKKYHHDTDFKRFVKQRYAMQGCANVDQYLKMFEEIMNYHRREKIKLTGE